MITVVTRDTRGITLIEVMITAMILSVAFLGLSATMGGTIRGLAFSKDMLIATTLAQEKVEQVKPLDYHAINTANLPQEPYGAIPGYTPFRRFVEVQENTPQNNMKTVTVTTSWKNAANVTKQVNLNLIIAK